MGFSSPNPAPVPDEVEDALERDGPVSFISDDVSCENCSHYPVCAYYAGFASMLENSATPSDSHPIDARLLAAICDAYDPESEGET